MVNIVSNNCIGGYLYSDNLKIEHQNPFVWCSINLDNFCKLIKYYNEINFNNIECSLLTNNSGICKQGSMTPKIVIDNMVEINYFHYIKNEKYKTPTKISGYVMYNNIEDYTVSLYKERVKRMTDQPLFIWDVTQAQWYNEEQINVTEMLETIKSEYKIVVYQPNVVEQVKDNIIILNKTNSSFEVNTSAKNIYQKIKDNFI